jgi:hypothetical protein
MGRYFNGSELKSPNVHESVFSKMAFDTISRGNFPRWEQRTQVKYKNRKEKAYKKTETTQLCVKYEYCYNPTMVYFPSFETDYHNSTHIENDDEETIILEYTNELIKCQNNINRDCDLPTLDIID